MDELLVYSNEKGEGFSIAYDNGSWAMGIKNWKPGSDITLIDTIERHLETDEIFVPVTGLSIIIIANKTGDTFSFTATKLENGHFYCIPKGVWHNAIMTRDAKICLIERPGTTPDNSEFISLDGCTAEELRNTAKEVI